MEQEVDLEGLVLIVATYSGKAVIKKAGVGPLRGSFIQDTPFKNRIQLPRGTVLSDLGTGILYTTTDRGFKIGV